MAAAVPSPDAVPKLAAYAAADTPILQAGDTVSLQVTTSGQSAKPDLTQTLTETFRGKLAAAGYQVGDGRPFRLQVAVNEEDSGRQLQYQTFGRPQAGATVQVPDRRVACKVAFADSTGKEVWQTWTTCGPAMMSFNRDGGDMVKQLLDGRWQSLDHWIQSLRLAKLIRRFSSAGKFGTSQLTAAGEQILNVPTP